MRKKYQRKILHTLDLCTAIEIGHQPVRSTFHTGASSISYKKYNTKFKYYT